ICSLLLAQRIEQRALRGLDITQGGMNAPDDLEGARQRVRKTKLAESFCGRLSVREGRRRIAHGVEHGRMDRCALRSAVLIVQRMEHCEAFRGLRSSLVQPALVQRQLAQYAQRGRRL